MDRNELRKPRRVGQKAGRQPFETASNGATMDGGDGEECGLGLFWGRNVE